MADEAHRKAWTALCAGLPRTAGDVHWFGLGARYAGLLEATRAGEDTLTRWHALEEEIARLAAAELDQTIRHGEFADEASSWQRGPVTTHDCPRGRCDRVVHGTPDRPPQCRLFDVPMPEQA